MTVRELIAALSKYAEANPRVVATWEATVQEIDEDQIYLSADGDVVIDADANTYKEAFLTQPGLTRNRGEAP